MKARNNNGTIEYQINGDWLSEGNIAIELQETARLRSEVERLIELSRKAYVKGRNHGYLDGRL